MSGCICIAHLVVFIDKDKTKTTRNNEKQKQRERIRFYDYLTFPIIGIIWIISKWCWW
jgi:hypothetical protein